MRKILIATHGNLANGIKSSIDILSGEKNNIFYLNAYVDGTNIDEYISSFFKNLTSNDEAVVFTDILGGSVNQKFVKYCNMPNVHLISGFNLPIILEVILNNDKLSKDFINKKILECREQLIYVNELSIDSNSDGDFF